MAQPSPCKRGDKLVIQKREGRTERTCLHRGTVVRRETLDARGRLSRLEEAGKIDRFLETGQRVERWNAYTLEAQWWPEGCLAHSEQAAETTNSPSCWGQRSACGPSSDAGLPGRVLLLPPVLSHTVAAKGLPSVRAVAVDTRPDGGLRVCLSDGGPCEGIEGQAMVSISGRFVMFISPDQKGPMLLDGERRTLAPFPADATLQFLGDQEVLSSSGVAINYASGVRVETACVSEAPARRLDDGSLLCTTARGWRRTWKDRERDCTDAKLGEALVSSDYGVRVYRLNAELSPACAEVFEGLIDCVAGLDP